MDSLFQQYNLPILHLNNEQKLMLKLQATDFKRGTGKNAIRKIFSNVKYDLYEEQMLSMFRKDNDIDVPDDLLLRFLYANQFDMALTLHNLEEHYQFLDDGSNFKFTLSVEDLLLNGAFYIGGRGKSQKPILIVNTSVIDISRYSTEDITRALVINLMIMKKYMFEPGLVENWIVVIEAKDCSANKIPFSNIGYIFNILRTNFPGYLDRMFILAPQTSVQVIWQIVEQFIPYNSRHKIEFISNNLALMQNYISLEQLQQRHGGKMPNMYDFWPPSPINTNFDEELEAQREAQEVKKKLATMKNLLPFSSKIPQEVSETLRKKTRPKNKIYKEETYADHTDYYLNRNKQTEPPKTVFLEQVRQREAVQKLQPKPEQALQHSRFERPANKPKEELTGFRYYKSTANLFQSGIVNHKIHTIDDYDQLCAINKTDFTTVYKALDKTSGRIVAIKVINLVNQNDLAQAVQTYKNKPFKNLCQVYHCFGQEGKLYIVMEYFAGGSLKDLIKLFKQSNQTLSIEYVRVILKELVLGVQEIHQEGLVHRHIKSANLFLSSEGKVKLSYFSIDKTFSDTINKSQSHILSLPYWMAPETIQSSTTDQKSDIWAIGITAYELVTGTIPYEDLPPQKVIFKIVQQPPNLLGDYPPDVVDFVHSCLQRDSLKRPTSTQLLQHPFIRNAKRSQLLFELFEKSVALKRCESQQPQPENFYTHNRVITSMKIQQQQDEKTDDDEVKTETLKIRRTIRKIEKYKPGLGKQICQEIMQIYNNNNRRQT